MGSVCTRLLPWGNHLVVPTANNNDNSEVGALFAPPSSFEPPPSSNDVLPLTETPPGILSLFSEKKEEIRIESDEEGRNEHELSAMPHLSPLSRYEGPSHAYAIELPCLGGFGGSRELLLTAGGMPGLDWAGPPRRGPKLVVNEHPFVPSTTSTAVGKKTKKKTVRGHKRKLTQLEKELGTKRLLLGKGNARRDGKRQSRELRKGSPVQAEVINHPDGIVLVRRKSQRTTQRANFAALEREQDLLLEEIVGLGLCEDEEGEGSIDDDERDGNYVDQQSRSKKCIDHNKVPSIGCLSSSGVVEAISIADETTEPSFTEQRAHHSKVVASPLSQADNGSIALTCVPKACEDCKTVFLPSSASSDRLCCECRTASLRVRLLFTNTGYVVGSRKDLIANATRQVGKEHKALPNSAHAQAGDCNRCLDGGISLACNTPPSIIKPSPAIPSSKRKGKRKRVSNKKRTSSKGKSKRCKKSSSGRRTCRSPRHDGGGCSDCTATSPPKGASKEGPPPSAPPVAPKLATSITIPCTTSFLSSTPSSSLEASPHTESEDANPLTSSPSTSGQAEGKLSSKGHTKKRNKKRKHKPCRVCNRLNAHKDGTCSRCGIVPPATKSKRGLSCKVGTTKKRKVIPGEQPAPKRRKTSDDDAIVLRRAFRKNRWPSRNERIALAIQLEWTARRVQIWFQNQRQKQRYHKEEDEKKTARDKVKENC